MVDKCSIDVTKKIMERADVVSACPSINKMQCIVKLHCNIQSQTKNRQTPQQQQHQEIKSIKEEEVDQTAAIKTLKAGQGHRPPRMRLWKRASAAFKDKTSLWQANLFTRRTSLRNPDIDKAVIRATTHCDSHLDRRNIDRVCQWLRLSPLNLKPILWSISARLEKTRDWSVALKGLLLTHAVITSKTPAVKTIGRLPFDLSGFKDGHSSQAKVWPFNAFVRAYYAFLDHKSAMIFQLAEDNHDGGGFAMRRELERVQELQRLADLLLEIKPASTAAFMPLVLDVMDGIMVEVYDVYSKICRGIAMVLMNIYAAEKGEAAAALRVVQKATQQGDSLTYFLERCAEMGVINASEFPVVDRIPDEAMRELEQIIESFDENDDEFKTIITQEWERFDQDFVAKNQEPPDLITFL